MFCPLLFVSPWMHGSDHCTQHFNPSVFRLTTGCQRFRPHGRVVHVLQQRTPRTALWHKGCRNGKCVRREQVVHPIFVKVCSFLVLSLLYQTAGLLVQVLIFRLWNCGTYSSAYIRFAVEPLKICSGEGGECHNYNHADRM